MRTTISISEELLKKAQQVSGKAGYSEAIVTSIQDYIALKQRLKYLDGLFSKKTPHSFQTIKKMRRKRRWSS